MLSNRKGKPQERGKRYEIKKASDHKAKRIGGPNHPDAIIKGGGKMEIKDWSKPVPKSEVVKANRKGVKKFIAKSGFTEPAIEYGKGHRMKLYKGKKRLT
jgi:hypothetical protein